jgi:hypothetical protein
VRLRLNIPTPQNILCPLFALNPPATVLVPGRVRFVFAVTNDEVRLLNNAAVPFILRPYGESQYPLVGEAYVHGIMHAQLVAEPGETEGFEI